MPSLPAAIEPLALLFGALGFVWGVAADRIGARWPAHEDGTVRALDWRTIVVALFGAVALATIPGRFGGTPERVLFTVYLAGLILLMATDLDQRLMPDVVNLPLVGLAGVAALAGFNPLLEGKPWWLTVLGAIGLPLVLFVASIPFGAGAFGGGDVKFLAGLGLLAGLVRSVVAVFAGALLSGVIIAVLLVTRRITMKSYIPFGPFLIAGALWAILLPTGG